MAMRLLVAVAMTSLLAVAVGQPPMALKIERRLSNVSTKHLMMLDELRHIRLGGGAVQLPLTGSAYDYLAGGPYLTRVNLGNPPRRFNVLIDTGSSPSWVACQTTQEGLFDPGLSSTSSILTCLDNRCQKMVHDRAYYGLNLETIYVNGQKLGLDPSVFRPSAGYQTFADSGTSLAFLAAEAYDQFVSAIAAAVSPSANPTVESGDQHCFVPSSSIDSAFPDVTLHFEGGAAMQLRPKNYLRSRDNSIYCIAWQKNGQRVTILGDIVLADKLLVHDLENMVLGWIDYNCSRPIHVTTSSEKKNVNSAHESQKISMPIAIIILISLCFIFRP
ncbi:hypothetical protein ACQ4PT_014782 [Festuca glaucescens]